MYEHIKYDIMNIIFIALLNPAYTFIKFDASKVLDLNQ